MFQIFFLRFYFTAESLQTVLIECDYWNKLFVATVTVFSAKAWLRFRHTCLKTGDWLKVPAAATACGSNQA